MDINRVLDIFLQGKNDWEAEGFVKFLSDDLWNKYNAFLMDKLLILENEVKTMPLTLPNAKEGVPYNQTVCLPDDRPDMFLVDVDGVTEDRHGLSVTVAEDGRSFTVSGTPSLEALRTEDGTVRDTNFKLTLYFRFKGFELPPNRPVLERELQIIINQDPRKLWKNIPVDWTKMSGPTYFKADLQAEYVKVLALPDGTPQKDIVAASKRGRSHAQEGKPRDDDFRLLHLDNGWYVMAVADGAGSAKCSREGSRLACETAVGHCMSRLSDSRQFEEAIDKYNASNGGGEFEARKQVGDFIHEIVGNAAFYAYKSIEAESVRTGIPLKAYSTTLLLAICKKFAYGWFVASFWVGDGAICLYDRERHTARILGTPDEGEYAGQTRFLTMQEIFKNTKEFYQRLRFSIVPDFTALMLMTDGVSDPKFETDANLLNPDKWDALWNDLRDNGVELTDDNEDAKEQLLGWLDFWSPGNHDDRTIAILY